MRESFVYRLETDDAPVSARGHGGEELFFLDSLVGLAKHAFGLLRLFGVAASLKALLKILSGRRFFCGLATEGSIASYVWITAVGKHYPIEREACVLGPLFTDPALRRRGFATAVLQESIAQLRARGRRILYIDTAATNIASQRAIARAGFGAPFAILQNGKLLRPAPEEIEQK